MDEFLKSYFSTIQNLQKEKLPGDGGHRNYTRIKFDKKTFMLMSCGKKDISLKHFIEIQKRLEPFVSVPKIFHHNLDQGFLLLEDLGNQSLEQFFIQKGIKHSFSFYQQALIQLLNFQNQIKTLPTDLLFDKDFFLKEMEMAIYHLQTYLNQSYKKKPNLFNEKSSLNFKKDMGKVLSHFKSEDYTYCHRDYHSRNLMIKKDKIILIDFQDAGFGPWYYDLTSLLYDSYIPLSPSQKQELSVFYLENAPKKIKKKFHTLSHIESMTKLQFLQRGFKACGCFAAFKNRDKKDTHLKYIKPTLSVLKKSARELDYLGIYNYINQMLEVLEDIAPK